MSSSTAGKGAVRTRRYMSVPSGTYPEPVRPFPEPVSLSPAVLTPPVVSAEPEDLAGAAPPPRPTPFAPAPPAPSEGVWDQDLLHDEFSAQMEEAMEREVLSPPIPALVAREESQGRWGGLGLGLLAGGTLGLLASFLLLRLIQPDLLERPVQALSHLNPSEMVSAALIFLAFLFLGAGTGSRWQSRRSSRG